MAVGEPGHGDEVAGAASPRSASQCWSPPNPALIIAWQTAGAAAVTAANTTAPRGRPGQDLSLSMPSLRWARFAWRSGAGRGHHRLGDRDFGCRKKFEIVRKGSWSRC